MSDGLIKAISAQQTFQSRTDVAGEDGEPGADGLSAYQIAVANGFVGTEVEWLASLEGPQGDPGPTGATGPEGPAGPQGDPGVGVPVGGGTGAALVKNSATDHDTAWGPVIASGTYTPTVTAVLNCSSVSHNGTAKYQRVGNIVTVSGLINGTATAAGVARIHVTLPVASTLTASADVVGVCGMSGDRRGPGIVYASAGEARLDFYPAAGGVISLGYTFQYEIK